MPRPLEECDWISIDEQDPPVDVGILVTNGVIVTAARFGGRDSIPRFHGHEFGGYEWEFDFEAWEITHWMLLPPPPPEVTPKKRPEQNEPSESELNGILSKKACDALMRDSIFSGLDRQEGGDKIKFKKFVRIVDEPL